MKNTRFEHFGARFEVGETIYSKGNLGLFWIIQNIQSHEWNHTLNFIWWVLFKLYLYLDIHFKWTQALHHPSDVNRKHVKDTHLDKDWKQVCSQFNFV